MMPWRLMTDAEIRERYGPTPNPYADYPQTFACQQIEVANAMRELMTLYLQAVARGVRRLCGSLRPN